MARLVRVDAHEPPGGLWDLLGIARPPEWVGDALCAQVDPDLFFPERRQRSAPARKVCALCGVRAECLADALADPSCDGVRGGTTQRQRAVIRRRSAQARIESGDIRDAKTLVALLPLAHWITAQEHSPRHQMTGPNEGTRDEH